jgi:hypothetical protein
MISPDADGRMFVWGYNSDYGDSYALFDTLEGAMSEAEREFSQYMKAVGWEKNIHWMPGISGTGFYDMMYKGGWTGTHVWRKEVLSIQPQEA